MWKSPSESVAAPAAPGACLGVPPATQDSIYIYVPGPARASQHRGCGYRLLAICCIALYICGESWPTVSVRYEFYLFLFILYLYPEIN
jgi:hypothetical protein